MPFKPLSNALLSPYKVPFGVHLYNYLITKNLRWLLNNSFFHPSPTFTLHILSIYFDRWWMLGVEWWVLMVSIKFIVNPHIIIPQHSISHIINTQHSLPIPQHSIPHIINTQHSSPIPQHPTPFPQHSTPHIINTQHSSPITQHPTPFPQHSTPHIINTQHPSPITQYPSPNISHPINFIISFFLCKFAGN